MVKTWGDKLSSSVVSSIQDGREKRLESAQDDEQALLRLHFSEAFLQWLTSGRATHCTHVPQV